MKLGQLLRKTDETTTIEIIENVTCQEKPPKVYAGELEKIPYTVYQRYKNAPIEEISTGTITKYNDETESIETENGIIIKILQKETSTPKEKGE